MNPASYSQRTRQAAAARRAELLTAFDRSGLSAAAFARKHQLNYTTFCGWRQRRDKAAHAPNFLEVELPEPSLSTELIVELGADIRLRISSASQAALAATLLANLGKEQPC